MNIQDSLLAPYVSDPNDDGSYVLNLSHEETMRLWEAVDAQSKELGLLRQLRSYMGLREGLSAEPAKA